MPVENDIPLLEKADKLHNSPKVNNNPNNIIIKEVQKYPTINFISYITAMQQGESKLRRCIFTQPHATARGRWANLKISKPTDLKQNLLCA